MTLPSHQVFFGLMAVASALGLAKSAALAAVLEPTAFTHYSVAFALVGITSSVISFGLTEGTVKRFVRLIEFGRSDELRATLGNDVRKLAWRHLAALVVLPAVAAAAGHSELLVPIASIVVLAFAVNAYGMASSLFRGYDRLIGLGYSSLLRAFGALFFAIVFAASIGWQGGLAAEALSTAAISVAFLYYLRTVVRRTRLAPTAGNADRHVSNERDGFWLFLAFTIAMIPISFDRAWVAYFANRVEASQYAFSGIWVGAAYTITSIYVQKFGPDVIRSRASDAKRSVLRMSLLHAATLSSLLVAGAAATFLCVYLFFPETFWNKYQLSQMLVVATLAALSVQVSPIFDWTLTALDSERTVAKASMSFALVMAALFGICAYLALGSEAYLGAFFVARAIQILVAATAIWRRTTG